MAIADPAERVRTLVLALVAFGLIATSVDLALLEHNEEAAMLVPFVVNTMGIVAAIAAAAAPSRGSILFLRACMVLLIGASVLGVVLHYQGSLEFQIDMDPTLSARELFWKVMHMKAPPTLAPGALGQFGLFGLAATYRHPAVRREA